MNYLVRLIPWALASFLVPAVVSAAVVAGVGGDGSFFIGFGNFNHIAVGCGVNTICVVAAQLLFIINYVLVPLLFAVAFIVFLYGIAKAYIFSGGDPEEVKRGHSLVLWGVAGFVIMVSLWGLVFIVSNTLGLAGYAAPPPPTSY